MSAAPTRDVIERAMAGEALAIGALLESAQVDIRRYARRSCRTSSDVEDAVQETLLILYRRIGALRQVEAFSGWLVTIVRRQCLRLASAMRLVEVSEAERALEEGFAHAPLVELRIDVARAIESLPEHYRQIVIMRDLEELTIDEICSRLQLTREAVKGRLHRARGFLREYLTR